LVSAPSKKLIAAPLASCGLETGSAIDCTRKGAADMILVA
jgi:hypothetical protein